MKLVAKVRRVAVRGIHKWAGFLPSGEMVTQDMPDTTRVETEVDEKGACMMYRYGEGDVFCGDTWHPSLEEAKRAAAYEYEIGENDWVVVNE